MSKQLASPGIVFESRFNHQISTSSSIICILVSPCFQENEQRRLQEEKAEKRRKAQAEISAKPKGRCFPNSLLIVSVF